MTNDNQDALRRADALQRCDCIDFDGDFTASAAHLRRLVAENEEKESALKIVEATCDDFATQNEAKDALLRHAEQDAARYRWLRDRFLAADFNWGDPTTCVWVFETDEPVSADLDASIDAAIRQHLEGRAS